MLIPSHRHTEADLVHWRMLEEADLIHGRSASLAAKVDRSLRVIEAFIAGGPCYCSVSWGKDSVVVADLVRRVAPYIPLAWVRVEPIKNPDCELVRDVMPYTLQPYTEFPSWCRRDAAGWHATGTLEFGVRRIEQVFGTQRRILGIRADESGIRKLSMFTHGLATENVCRPLGWWNVADVFGYLAIRNLPVHPVYAMTAGGRWPREHLRVASLGGERGAGMGRREWEREYYGDVLARIAVHGGLNHGHADC